MSQKKVQIPTWMKEIGYVKSVNGILGSLSGNTKVVVITKKGVVFTKKFK